MALYVSREGLYYAEPQLQQLFSDAVTLALERPLTAKGVTTLHFFDAKFEYIEPTKRTKDFYVILRGRAHTRPEGGLATPQKMWGFPSKLTYGALFEPSGQGLLIIEPESGYAVAELIGNNLYILFYLHGDDGLSQRSKMGIFRAILQEANSLLGGSIPLFEELTNGTYTAPGRKLLDTTEAENAERIKEAERSIGLVQDLAKKRENLGSKMEDATRVLKRIANIPEVKSVSMQSGKLRIQTHTMYALHAETKALHEFGEFSVVLTFGQNANATFRNQTRRPNDYGHPHVDRADGYWCQGEGAGILRLLSSYEFEAATMFALKAIESVNESRSGNYLAVLERFPKVAARMEYPKIAPDPDEQTKAGFLQLFTQTLKQVDTNLVKDLAAAEKKVVLNQKAIFITAFVRTLRLPQPEVVAKAARELEAVAKLPNVKKVSIKRDLLTVETCRLTATGPAGTVVAIGPFRLEYDFESGIATFKSAKPVLLPDGTALHAPHLPGAAGTPPVGQLTSTLPELMGSLELEALVAMSLDFLAQFDGHEDRIAHFAPPKKAA